MKSALFAFFALGVFTAPLASRAAPTAPKLHPFSYRLKLPISTASCADHAKQVASDFAIGATKAQTVAGICQSRQTVTTAQGETYELDIVLINYLATTEQHPARTVFGADTFMGMPHANAGVYATHAECLDEIAVQIPTFTTETGLTPFASYCQASTNDMYPGFSMTIESFGEFKKRRLFSFSLDGQATFESDGTEITQAALAAIKTVGARVVSAGATRIFYYFEYPIQISNPALGVFQEMDQCTSQMATAHAIYAKGGLEGVSAFCLVSPPPVSLTGKVKDAYVLMTVGAGQSVIMDSSSAQYETFDECMGDIDRLVQNELSNGRKIVGGLCAPSLMSHEGFSAHLYLNLY
jgi:hypothetical protein